MTVIRALAQADLPQAPRIVRVAFGTSHGAPEPEKFWSDLDYVHGRFGAEHTAAFAEENDEGALVGSNFTTRWGSVGFFGPLTTRPIFGTPASGSASSPPPAINWTPGVSAMPGCSPLPRAPSMSGSTAGSVFIRAF
jgi:hypothetical protein